MFKFREAHKEANTYNLMLKQLENIFGVGTECLWC